MDERLENSKNYRNVAEFFEDNGIEVMPKSTREIYKTINKVLSKLKEDEDCTDMDYSKDKTTFTQEEYFFAIKDINDRIHEGKRFKLITKARIKEERKEKIKTLFKLK